MAATIEITGLAELKADLKKLGRLLDKAPIVGRLAADARNIIVQRTLKGIDANGNKFAAYSKEPIYMTRTHRPRPHGGRRQSKTGTGRRLKTVAYDGGYAQFKREMAGHDTPDLFASGQMFRGFQAKTINSRRAIVMFTNRAAAEKALGNTAKREFVGLREVEVDKLQDRMDKHIDSLLKKLNL